MIRHIDDNLEGSKKTGARDFRTTFDYLGSIGTPLSRFDTIIEKLLVALLVFMPLALGARTAWSQEVVIGLSGVIVI